MEIVEYFEAKYKQLVPKDAIPFEGIDTRPGASSQTEEMTLEHTVTNPCFSMTVLDSGHWIGRHWGCYGYLSQKRMAKIGTNITSC